MHDWQRRRIDLINVLQMLVGYYSTYGSLPDPCPLTSLANFADDLTVVPFHPRRARGAKDLVKSLATVTHQHSAVSDSHALLAQHVVERCPAEM